MKTNLNFMCLFLFVTSISFAQVTDSTQNNMNRNEQMENDMDDYQSWDTSGDKAISATEFYRGTYNSLDTNRDENLSKKEWADGSTKYREYIRSEDFNKYDTDKNNELSRDEYNEGFSNSNFHKSYDANQDGKVEVKEIEERHNHSPLNNKRKTEDNASVNSEY